MIDSAEGFLGFMLTKWFKFTCEKSRTEEKYTLLSSERLQLDLLLWFRTLVYLLTVTQSLKVSWVPPYKPLVYRWIRKSEIRHTGCYSAVSPMSQNSLGLNGNHNLVSASHPSTLCVKVLHSSLASYKSGTLSQALKINLQRNYSVLFGYKGHQKFHI